MSSDEEQDSTARVVLITGGGTGIGAAISRAFLQNGDVVCINQRSVREASLAVAELRRSSAAADVRGFGFDLAKPSGAGELAAAVIDQLGRIDVLVNCAAVTGPGSGAPFLEIDDETIAQTLEVNTNSVIRLSRDVARNMALHGSGVIVSIGSVAADAAQMNATVYSASKGAIHSLTRGLALELAPHGIRAVTVSPGDIDTQRTDEPTYDDAGRPFWARATPLGRRGRPEDVAEAVLFAASARAAFITGSELRVDGGWLAY